MMRLIALAVLLGSAPLARCQEMPPLGVFVMGQARFSLLAAECIRIEFSPKSRFTDEPSLFAVERGLHLRDYGVDQSSGRLVLDTGRMRLVHRADGKPLSAANLQVSIRVGTQTVTWTPGLPDARNLGGIQGSAGLLSRGGWHLIDDSDGLIRQDGRIAARPAGRGKDWYLFGYGRDYKAGLRALTAVAGPAPLARRYALGAWQSGCAQQGSPECRRVALSYQQHGFPLDVLVMDEPRPESVRWSHERGLFAVGRSSAEGVDFERVEDGPPGPGRRLGRNELAFQRSELQNLRGQVLSRWGGWGDHRHPSPSSGDACTGWPMLASAVRFTAAAGNLGAFFMSHGIGGAREGELTARAAQFAAFSAALRLRSPGPWSFSKPVAQALRASFELRATLFPYTYSTAWQAHQDSLPLARPLYLEYPDPEDAYRNPQEYLYGDAFLVAPIVSPGSGPLKTGRQTVWFPPGAWYDWFTGEQMLGPARRVVRRDVGAFPLYVRAGTPVAMQPFTPRMGSEPLRTLVVRVYPGPDGQTGRALLYEDDGLSREYLEGRRALTELSYIKEGDKATVTVGPTQGSYSGQIPARALVVELPGFGAPRRAAVDGQTAPAGSDPRTGTCRITLPERDIRQGTVVEVWEKLL